MAGRKAKVTTDKKARKYQRDRTATLQRHDATMSPIQQTAPHELVGVARTAYKKIVTELDKGGMLRQLDLSIVVQLCKQIQINRAAYQHIFVGVDGGDPEGIQTPIYKAVQGPSGEIKEHQFTGYKRNPAVMTLDSSTAKIKSLCETLGMTPSSRASLLQLTTGDDDDDESISDLMSKAKTDF